MKYMKYPVVIMICFFTLSAVLGGCVTNEKENMKDKKPQFEVMKLEKEWKEILTPEQYHVLWEKGTEPAFA